MKRLIWRIRAARYLHSRLDGMWSWRDCWEYSAVLAEPGNYCEDPLDAVDEELSCWED